MKLMSRDFTRKEKVLLLILTMILLGAVYYLAVDQPVRSAISEAVSEQENLNTQLLVLQQKAALLSRMVPMEKWEVITMPKQSWTN